MAEHLTLLVRTLFTLSVVVMAMPCAQAQQHSTLNRLTVAQTASHQALRAPGQRAGSGQGPAAVGGRLPSLGLAPVHHPVGTKPKGRLK